MCSLAEAYQILKEQVSKEQAPLNPHSDSVEYIESLDWPPVPDESHLEQPPAEMDAAHNGSEHEFILFDEPEPRRRVARLVRSIKRLDVASVGIYHPTLVPLEDKRIAGVSSWGCWGCNMFLPHWQPLKSSLLMNVQLQRVIKFNGSSLWQHGNIAIDLACN